MVRRKFTKEFKFEAVKLVTERGVAVAQAKQPVGESLSIIGQHPGDLHRGCARQIA